MNENKRLTYTQIGDYLIPNLMMNEQPEATPGKYGMLRKTYLKEHRGGMYQYLLLSGKLTEHLLEIDQTASQRVEQIVNQMLLTNPAPDKATDPIAWVQHMTALNQTAEEMVLNDLIYA